MSACSARIRLVSFISFSFLSVIAQAETGVTNEIVIGQSIPFTGALADLGREYTAGANLYFDRLNSTGGVHGRKIKLVSLDDGYDVKRAISNTGRLLDQNGVFAVFGQFGTGIVLATAPMITSRKVPLFAPYTGADDLRDNTNRYLFHIRASYGEEAEKMVEQLVSTGVHDIAVIHQNDAFGKAGLLVAEKAMKRRNIKPVAIGAIDISPSVNVGKAIQIVAAAHPAAIIVIAAGKGAIGFISAFQKTGQTPQYFCLSVVSSGQLVKELGSGAHGIVIAQVMPSPWRASNPVVRDYQQLLEKKKIPGISYTSFEGYMAARIFAEALRRTGRDLTREKFVSSLESLRNFDAGGLVIDFAPGKRSGSNFVDLSIISKGGMFLR